MLNMSNTRVKYEYIKNRIIKFISGIKRFLGKGDPYFSLYTHSISTRVYSYV